MDVLKPVEGEPAEKARLRALLAARFGELGVTDSVVINLHAITAGLNTVQEVGEPFSYDRGTLRINVKGTSLEGLYHAIHDD